MTFDSIMQTLLILMLIPAVVGLYVYAYFAVRELLNKGEL